jgi:hypothetical protein
MPPVGRPLGGCSGQSLDELLAESLDAVAVFLTSDLPFSDFDDLDDSLLSFEDRDDSLFSFEEPVLESVL